MKTEIERLVNVENFSMNNLAQAVWPSIERLPELVAVVNQLKAKFGDSYKKLTYAILRSSFLIELVKIPKIDSTKFRVRWFDQLINDPRYCSYEECLSIAKDLLINLPSWLKNQEHEESLKLSLSNGLIPYEAPIDYDKRFGSGDRIHKRNNVVWLSDTLVLRTLKLRKYLTDAATSTDHQFFRSLLKDKIQVKTYLTDRVLTGDHKTNREKRWETHPDSVHFAERRVCMAIEYALVTQICSFKGFPDASLKILQNVNILPQNLPIALCPITGDALSYQSFRDELLNPTHGKSDFQVGHLNPLKLGSDGIAAGHTADNISWITADGNRIQGSLSLESVRVLIQRIAENYSKFGWWPKK